MAKYNRVPKLTKSEREDLFLNFCQALASLKTTREVALFIRDLLGLQEVEMMAKRLEVAKLLVEGDTYEEIAEELKVSHGTIARVNLWLQMSGAGYRMVLKRNKKKPIKYDQHEEDWKRFKKSHSRYFWPELLFEEVIKQLGRKKKEKLLKNLGELEDKKGILMAFDENLKEIYQSKSKTSPS